MKQDKKLIYLLSGLFPVFLFFACATINNYIPLGKYGLNIIDSYTQYPGMVLEYGNLLKHGGLFFSWNAGLGFNFFGTLTYYSMSPLNLLCVFATTSNYVYYAMVLIYIRLFLLGISMCFYLDKRGTKTSYTIIFSIIYALMGFTATYYYNFMWIDSIIMLPLVIHGLDKLIDNKKPTFYIVSLTLSIIFNYYIGYMICIFSFIYFIYRMVSVNKRKKVIITFIISSILSGLMCTFILLPTFFALMNGKATIYNQISYGGISRNAFTFFYSLTSGSYLNGDHKYGPAQVYSTIFCIVLVIYYLFNKKVELKEKIAVLSVLGIFYISFAINIVNYAWQFFQKPVWWNSRFSFTFSFFIILIAIKSLEKIDKVEIKNIYKIGISILFILASLIGLYFKRKVSSPMNIDTYIYLIFSFILFILIIFLLDKKKYLPLVLILTLLDLSVNTFNNLKQNNEKIDANEYSELKKELPKIIKNLNKNNDFYRFELADKYSFNDGLYFNYHGINYFNSVKNINVVRTVGKLGTDTPYVASITLNEFDPVFLSLFNIKYVYSDKPVSYYIDKGNKIYENTHPLALGYIVSSDIKNYKIKSDNSTENVSNLINALMGEDSNIYKHFDKDSFINDNNEYKYNFVSDDHYLVVPNECMTIIINGKEFENENVYPNITKGDKVEVIFYVDEDNQEPYLDLLDLYRYEDVMNKLSNEILHADVNRYGHILQGTINVKKNDSYMFTTIPYEEGMKIYVDGKEKEPDILIDSFIGLDLDRGKHSIVIDYIPKGLVIGSIISLISLLGSIVYLWKIYK